MLGFSRKFGSAELSWLSETFAPNVCQKVWPNFGRTESSVYHYYLYLDFWKLDFWPYWALVFWGFAASGILNLMPWSGHFFVHKSSWATRPPSPNIGKQMAPLVVCMLLPTPTTPRSWSGISTNCKRSTRSWSRSMKDSSLQRPSKSTAYRVCNEKNT